MLFCSHTNAKIAIISLIPGLNLVVKVSDGVCFLELSWDFGDFRDFRDFGDFGGFGD
jgi:hypothetical protein